jgi:hypothetical protein
MQACTNMQATTTTDQNKGDLGQMLKTVEELRNHAGKLT